MNLTYQQLPGTLFLGGLYAAAAGHVELKIYDLTGALVKTAHSGFVQPGGYEFVWRGEDDGGRRVASGVSIYRLKAGGTLQTNRMTLLK
jgi:flagellar hook assembly protein FlgD